MLPWHKSCDGKCSFFVLILNFSVCNPSCCLVTFDMGNCDLIVLLWSICISDCRLLDNGVFLYIIKRKEEHISSLVTSFIHLAYESISSYLHNRRQKALEKAFVAMENKVNVY